MRGTLRLDFALIAPVLNALVIWICPRAINILQKFIQETITCNTKNTLQLNTIAKRYCIHSVELTGKCVPKRHTR